MKINVGGIIVPTDSIVFIEEHKSDGKLLGFTLHMLGDRIVDFYPQLHNLNLNNDDMKQVPGWTAEAVNWFPDKEQIEIMNDLLVAKRERVRTEFEDGYASFMAIYEPEERFEKIPGITRQQAMIHDIRR